MNYYSLTNREYEELGKAHPKDATDDDMRYRTYDREELVSSFVQFDLKARGIRYDQQEIEIFAAPWKMQGKTAKEYFSQLQKKFGVTDKDIETAARYLEDENNKDIEEESELDDDNIYDRRTGDTLVDDLDERDDYNNSYNPFNLSLDSQNEPTQNDDVERVSNDKFPDRGNERQFDLPTLNTNNEMWTIHEDEDEDEDDQGQSF